ncbi:unnamed protein product, partial [Darwinula stevensoni]
MVRLAGRERKSGLIQVSNGRSQPEAAKLFLFEDSLTVVRKQPPWRVSQDVKAYPKHSKERVVRLVKQKAGGLGLSVKGGVEHNLPILVSKVFKDQPADISGQVFIGDAIVKGNPIIMNEESLVEKTHEEAVAALHNSGDEVTLVLKYYKAATPYLLKSLARQERTGCGRRIPLELRGEDGWKGLADETSEPDSPTHENGNSLKEDSEWTITAEVPLLMAYVTRYIFGTDQLRPKAFEVRSIDGSTTGIVHCSDLADMADWLKCIIHTIVGLNNLQMKVFNGSLTPSEQITYMGWVCEGFEESSGNASSTHWQNWKPKFVALKGANVLLFGDAPVSARDWLSPSVCYKIYETLFRVVKASECMDQRQHCFLLQTASRSHESHYFSLESHQELGRIEKAWHQALYLAVFNLYMKTFAVYHEGRSYGLSLDWNQGFVLGPPGQPGGIPPSPNIVWRYKFSQLKGSSDDGKSKLKLQFQNPITRQMEVK